MIIIDDILNELYTINNDHWYDNVLNILDILDFPVSYDYSCLWEEFLYVHLERFRVINEKDRKILTECKMIAHYQMKNKFSRINVFAIKITDSVFSRNESVYEITHLFRRIYGQLTILIFVNGEEIAFSGIAVDQHKKTEIIISEWFGFERERELNEKILEINFCSFTGNTLRQVYNNYLWAISRIYVRYRESKMYMIYGCDNVITYEVWVKEYDGEILTKKIDREETLRINSYYYRDIYGLDYFVDSSNIEMESMELLEDADDIEFEWTMLEMELMAEEIEEYYEEDFKDLSEEDEESEEESGFDEELRNLNPEEMLKFIRGE